MGRHHRVRDDVDLRSPKERKITCLSALLVIFIVSTICLSVGLVYYVNEHEKDSDDGTPVAVSSVEARMASTDYAVAVLTPVEGSHENVRGVVRLWREGKVVRINAKVHGLTPNSLHGFHVFENSDFAITGDAMALGPVFNPDRALHGCPQISKTRAVGDLGNLETDDRGVSQYDVRNELVSLGGRHSVIGRAIGVHQNRDDCVSMGIGDAGAVLARGLILVGDPTIDTDILLQRALQRNFTITGVTEEEEEEEEAEEQREQAANAAAAQMPQDWENMRGGSGTPASASDEASVSTAPMDTGGVAPDVSSLGRLRGPFEDVALPRKPFVDGHFHDVGDPQSLSDVPDDLSSHLPLHFHHHDHLHLNPLLDDDLDDLDEDRDRDRPLVAPVHVHLHMHDDDSDRKYFDGNYRPAYDDDGGDDDDDHDGGGHDSADHDGGDGDGHDDDDDDDDNDDDNDDDKDDDKDDTVKPPSKVPVDDESSLPDTDESTPGPSETGPKPKPKPKKPGVHKPKPKPKPKSKSKAKAAPASAAENHEALDVIRPQSDERPPWIDGPPSTDVPLDELPTADETPDAPNNEPAPSNATQDRLPVLPPVASPPDGPPESQEPLSSPPDASQGPPQPDAMQDQPLVDGPPNAVGGPPQPDAAQDQPLVDGPPNAVGGPPQPDAMQDQPLVDGPPNAVGGPPQPDAMQDQPLVDGPPNAVEGPPQPDAMQDQPLVDGPPKAVEGPPQPDAAQDQPLVDGPPNADLPPIGGPPQPNGAQPSRPDATQDQPPGDGAPPPIDNPDGPPPGTAQEVSPAQEKGPNPDPDPVVPPPPVEGPNATTDSKAEVTTSDLRQDSHLSLLDDILGKTLPFTSSDPLDQRLPQLPDAATSDSSLIPSPVVPPIGQPPSPDTNKDANPVGPPDPAQLPPPPPGSMDTADSGPPPPPSSPPPAPSPAPSSPAISDSPTPTPTPSLPPRSPSPKPSPPPSTSPVPPTPAASVSPAASSTALPTSVSAPENKENDNVPMLRVLSKKERDDMLKKGKELRKQKEKEERARIEAEVKANKKRKEEEEDGDDDDDDDDGDNGDNGDNDSNDNNNPPLAPPAAAVPWVQQNPNSDLPPWMRTVVPDDALPPPPSTDNPVSRMMQDMFSGADSQAVPPGPPQDATQLPIFVSGAMLQEDSERKS
eukprot:TRINITY_DN365_c0_g3_i2.p1 TRINITY_DN365_c0_g3~~TRINITY_DN365_c0_g3_i2.p1  ORF type:complete len:1178 (-),score=302.03 TRINITY_DN365_c0_g3_i2:52-3552(-)